MAILRWDAAKDLMYVQDRISKLFEYALSSLDVDIRFPTPWVPLCDVYENSTSFVLKVEVPGMSLDDIILEVNGSTVTIVGARKKSDISEENFHRIERNFGKFIRNFILPCNVDENNVTASLRDGVMTVTILKSQPLATGAVVKVTVK